MNWTNTMRRCTLSRWRNPATMTFHYVFAEMCLLVVSKLLCKMSGLLFVLAAQIQNGCHVIFVGPLKTSVDSRYSSRVLYSRTTYDSSCSSLSSPVIERSFYSPFAIEPIVYVPVGSDVVQCRHEQSPGMFSWRSLCLKNHHHQVFRAELKT